MPRAPLGLHRLLLCLLIPSTVLLLFFIGFRSLKEAPVRDLKSYSGSLSSVMNATPISLPPGVQMKSLFATEGDTVSKGQTIGIIDMVALERTIDERKEGLLAKQSLRDCLTVVLTEASQKADIAQPNTPTVSAPLTKSIPAECSDIRTAINNRDITFSEKKAILNKRIGIMKSKQAVLFQAVRNHATETDLAEAMAIRSLENAMTITSLQQAIADLAHEYRETTSQIHKRHRDKIASLTEEILIQEEGLLALQKIQNNPLLRAPASGTAHLVQTDEPNDKFTGPPRQILEIVEKGPPEIRVTFLIAENDAAETPIGSRVQIRPLGATRRQLSLTGKVTGYYTHTSLPDTDPQISAEVALSADSKQRLIANMNQHSHSPPKAAIILHVNKAPKPLGEILKQHELVLPILEKTAQLRHQLLERFSRLPVEDQTIPALSDVRPIEGAG